MMIKNIKLRLTVTLTVSLFLLTGLSNVLAGQVGAMYVESGGSTQNMALDTNSSAADLALAASLMGEDGVGVTYDPNTGSDSIADIAGAMAAAAPLYAANIAETLAGLSPDDTADIVAAINAVSGVNTKAVLAAVHFGPPSSTEGPQQIGSESGLDMGLNAIESIPSRN